MLILAGLAMSSAYQTMVTDVNNVYRLHTEQQLGNGL